MRRRFLQIRRWLTFCFHIVIWRRKYPWFLEVGFMVLHKSLQYVVQCCVVFDEVWCAIRGRLHNSRWVRSVRRRLRTRMERYRYRVPGMGMVQRQQAGKRGLPVCVVVRSSFGMRTDQPCMKARRSSLRRSLWVRNRPCAAPAYTLNWLSGIARAVLRPHRSKGAL